MWASAPIYNVGKESCYEFTRSPTLLQGSPSCIMQGHRAVGGVLCTLPLWPLSHRCEQTLLGDTALFHSTLPTTQSLVRGCGGSSQDEACVQVSQHSCSLPVPVAQLEVGGGSVLKGRSWPKHISVSENKHLQKLLGVGWVLIGDSSNVCYMKPH